MVECEVKTCLSALLNEKSNVLRRRCELLWNQAGPVKLSASEWYVLTKIGKRRPSISEFARMADMTRQAAHKYVHGLQNKGLLQSVEDMGSKRDKYVELSSFGKQCLEHYLSLQAEMECEIARVLGDDDLHRLKQLLERQWFSISA